MASSEELPMPTPTVPVKPLTSFKLISYDIFGTLIDWENSIAQNLKPLITRIPSSNPASKTFRSISDGTIDAESRFNLAAVYHDHEHVLKREQPTLRYDKMLTQTALQLCEAWDVPLTDEVRAEADAFGQSLGSWPAFPDTVEACQRLAKHYKLVPLSNVDRAGFKRTCEGPLKGVDFWRIYTAEEIGSYKPDIRNFEYLVSHVIEDGGVQSKNEILHVAQSLPVDHTAAKKMGLSSVWINRKGAGMAHKEARRLHEAGEVGYGWRFATLGELADQVEREFAEMKQ